MPTKAKQRKFHITLASQTNEHKRYVTVTRVPCPKCENDPIKRGGYYLSEASKTKAPVCPGCDGRGDVPATKDSAAAFVEAREQEYARFRLDELETIARYPALSEESLAVVQQTCLYVPQDTVNIDGRFLRGGKVVRNPSPDPSGPRYSSLHRGWLGFHEQEEPYKVMEVGDLGIVAAVTGFVYGLPMRNLLDGTRPWDWNTDTIKQSLHTAYTVDIDVHEVFSTAGVSSTEVAATGNYTAGGATLTTPTVVYDTASDQTRCDADNTTWASSTISATDAVTYKSTGTASTSPLICSIDFGATVATTSGTFTITHDATGIHVIDNT